MPARVRITSGSENKNYWPPMNGRVGEDPKGCLSPRRTGRADFPHPALLKTLVSGSRWMTSSGTSTQAAGDGHSRSLPAAVGTGAGFDGASSDLPQPIAEMPVDLPIRIARVTQRKAVRPTFQLPIQSLDQSRNRRTSLTAIRQFVNPIRSFAAPSSTVPRADIAGRGHKGREAQQRNVCPRESPGSLSLPADPPRASCPG